MAARHDQSAFFISKATSYACTCACAFICASVMVLSLSLQTQMALMLSIGHANGADAAARAREPVVSISKSTGTGKGRTRTGTRTRKSDRVCELDRWNGRKLFHEWKTTHFPDGYRLLPCVAHRTETETETERERGVLRRTPPERKVITWQPAECCVCKAVVRHLERTLDESEGGTCLLSPPPSPTSPTSATSPTSPPSLLPSSSMLISWICLFPWHRWRSPGDCRVPHRRQEVCSIRTFGGEHFFIIGGEQIRLCWN